MKRRALLSGLLLTVLLLALGGHARPAHATAYLFQDEFTGAAGAPPDPAKWWVTSGSQGNPWCDSDQYNCYDAMNVYQDGLGHLVLQTTGDPAAPPWSSARLQGFVEGFWPPHTVKWSVAPPVHIEASILMPPALGGLWAGLWPTAVDMARPVLEQDVDEYRGAHPHDLSCHVHGLFEWNGMGSLPPGASNYVTYWEDYYPTHTDFGATLANGVTVACGTATYNSTHAVSVRLDNHVGKPGTWGGDGGPPPAGTYLMLVDYVRAWAI